MHAIYELNLMLLLKNVRYDVAQFVAKTYSVSINMFDRSIAHIRFGIHFFFDLLYGRQCNLICYYSQPSCRHD